MIKHAAGPQRDGRSATWWLALVTTVGMFVANTLGFTDTVTGSAMGCGRSWPLCNGQLIPNHWGMATTIEYVHRLSAILAGLLLILLAVAALRKHGRRPEVKALVAVAFAGVLVEGAFGALAVVFVNPPAVLAAHLGVALWAIVGVFLLTMVIGQLERRPVGEPLRPHTTRAGLRGLVWLTIAYAYAAIYVGAYVASTGDGARFQGWPLPAEGASAGPVFLLDILHRSVAAGFLLLVLLLLIRTRRTRRERPDLYRGSAWAMVFVVLQMVSGGLMIATHVSVLAFLIHVTLASGLFVSLTYLGLQVLPEPGAALAGYAEGMRRAG